MTITHHPAAETIAAYVSGALDEGRRLVIASHIERCAGCHRWQAALERVGGVLLTETVPTAMRPDALQRALARLDLPEPARDNSQDRPVPPNDLPMLPDAARAHAIGAWSWSGIGIRHRPVKLSETGGARVFLLKVAPGVQLPKHTHTGTELTLVLSGAFSHAGGRFGPGDIEEADDSVDLVPVVEAGEACVCLVAMEGQLRLLGPFGRLLQPLVRF